MKKFIYAICLFFIHNISFAQPTKTYFNKIIDSDTLNIGSTACLALDYGYLVAGTYAATSGSHTALFVYQLNWQGEILWFKPLITSNVGTAAIGGGILIQCKNGNFILTGSKLSKKENGETDRNIAVIKFQINGIVKVLWEKYIGDLNISEHAYHIEEVEDGNLILAGEKQIGGLKRFYILKMDSEGILLWDKVIQPENRAAAFCARKAKDGNGYVFAGSMGTPQSPYKIILLNISEDGKIIHWKKLYGGEDSNAGAFFQETENGYLVYGGRYEGITLNMYNFEIDTKGEILWSKEYYIPEDIETIQTRPLITPDGGSIGVCYIWKGNSTIPLIMRFDEKGDTLWTKKIKSNDLDFTQDYIKDIEFSKHEGGGYILAGFNYTSQYSWVLKIDDEGNTCWPVGCDSTVTITSIFKEQLNKNSFVFQIYPNPTNRHLHLSFSDYVSGDVVISDVAGRELRRVVLVGVKEQEIDLGRDLESGVYFCSFYSVDGGVWVERFVVMR